MPKFDTIRRMPHSAETIYDIVADVERYPEFLPYCEKLIIIDETNDETGHLLEADMTVGYKAIQETFRSKVILDPTSKTITSTNLNGPFKHLENRWHFKPLSENQTDVHFFIDYAFKNWAMEKLMGSLFEKAFRTYATSFEERAKNLANENQ